MGTATHPNSPLKKKVIYIQTPPLFSKKRLRIFFFAETEKENRLQRDLYSVRAAVHISLRINYRE